MGDWVTAAATVVTAISTAALAATAWWQLSALRRQLSLQAVQLKILRDRDKQWRTVEACERYTYDPVLREVKLKIWTARDCGKLDCIPDPQACRQNVVTLLNYFDAVGVGVQQGVYLEDIVRDHLRVVVIDSVRRFVKGGWGNFDLDESHLTGLMHLYQRFSQATPTHKATS